MLVQKKCSQNKNICDFLSKQSQMIIKKTQLLVFFTI